MVRERIPVEANNQKLEVGKLIKSLVTNRTLLGIIAAEILLLLFIYPLNKKRVEENCAELAARRG